jgi:protein-tyrosine phosphatase
MNSLKRLIPQSLIDQYGTPRGVLQVYWNKFLNLIGYYRKYSTVDWNSIDRLVFVCKGNICRSAYAEIVARSIGVDSISCGVSTKDNVPANDDAIKTAESRGLSLKEHRTSRLTSIELKSTDLLIAMEPWHVEALERYCEDHLNAKSTADQASNLASNPASNKADQPAITLLGLWGPSKRPHLPDPYGRTSVYFNNCFDYIEKSVYEIEKKISGS